MFHVETPVLVYPSLAICGYNVCLNGSNRFHKNI